MSKFWSKIVENLSPYVPGEQPKLDKLIKLNTNENPYGASPSVFVAINKYNNDSLRLYPDPNSDLLKETIAKYYGIHANQVFIGNGSDEVLAHAFQGLLKHDLSILFPDITYSFYPVYCNLYSIDFQTIPLTENFQINVNDYTIPNGGIIFPNPNAPTGCLLSLDKIKQILDNNRDSVVVVDEAYIDFGGNTAVTLINDYPNLLVIQTLSKSRSLAGLRVGYAMGDANLIEALDRVKNSFNSYPIDRLAGAGAVAAFEDNAHFETTRAKIINSRENLSNEFIKLGFEVLPSAANFLLVRHQNKQASQLASQLRTKNIIIRHFNQPRIENFLRITVGTEDECEMLLNALRTLV